MRGYSIVDRLGRISFAGGLSFMTLQNDEFSETEKSDVGVILSTDFFVTPFKELGTGIELNYFISQEFQSIGLRLVFAIEGHK